MLNAAKDSNFVEAMYKFNKLKLNFEELRKIDKDKCAIYYDAAILQ